jgi:hypothetical protein
MPFHFFAPLNKEKCQAEHFLLPISPSGDEGHKMGVVVPFSQPADFVANGCAIGLESHCRRKRGGNESDAIAPQGKNERRTKGKGECQCVKVGEGTTRHSSRGMEGDGIFGDRNGPISCKKQVYYIHSVGQLNSAPISTFPHLPAEQFLEEGILAPNERHLHSFPISSLTF